MFGYWLIYKSAEQVLYFLVPAFTQFHNFFFAGMPGFVISDLCNHVNMR